MALKWDKYFVIPRILFNKALTSLWYKVRGSRALRRVEISLYKIRLVDKNRYLWILYHSAFEILHLILIAFSIFIRILNKDFYYNNLLILKRNNFIKL